MTDRNIQVKRNERPAREEAAEPARDRAILTPACDICETEQDIVLTADMPGVPADAIDLQLDQDVLTVTGEQAEEKAEGRDRVHTGYRTGIFRRSFSLLTGVDRDHIRAHLANGVLTVTLPKAEEARPRKIEVRTG
ncbi:Hsp20/alpha crystallin family protein [Kiritimatiella glycovorans]|uniref:Heat shock protein Hsp20 n=1 Tax=Kiritimatiella glycovorans TaxID=1307763 RepID=A0A0G3EA45_9BACT|nr:Hsp20/alpha crystallin family protein [Kiritimatiella glycovorans]AKJ63311.1 heat shock protein Hsp20 [Kiritimatiella glycovorans]